MACFYARPEGASQREVNDVSAKFGSSQRTFHNMLRTAQDWGHQVIVWHDATRGGKVYKLKYNPAHKARAKISPPEEWEEANRVDAPADAILSEWV